jgi:small subunit ribosomal protein S3
MDIDYANVFAQTVYGKIGIKVWICKGEVLAKRDLNPNIIGTVTPAGGERRGGDDRGGDRRDDRGGRGGDRNRGGGGGDRNRGGGGSSRGGR